MEKVPHPDASLSATDARPERGKAAGEGRADGTGRPNDTGPCADAMRDACARLAREQEANTALRGKLEECRSRLRSYSVNIERLKSQIDSQTAELRSAESQIDELRSDYVALKSTRAAELKQAILSVQGQLSRNLEDTSFHQQWIAALCRAQSSYIGDLQIAFDTDYYLNHNPDLAEAYYLGRISSPFEHWIASGANEGRAAKFKHGPYKE